MVTVGLYAGLLSLIFVGLSVRTLLLRRRFQIAIGDGADVIMQRAMRAHGNFAEYVPLALILLYLLETEAGYTTLIHVLGVVLLAGRLSHAYGVSQVVEDFRFRVAGMACTFVVLIMASVRLLFAWLQA